MERAENKEITLIELLERLAKKENMPSKIIYENAIYAFDESMGNYCSNHGNTSFILMVTNMNKLNDKVYVLSDDEYVENILDEIKDFVSNDSTDSETKKISVINSLENIKNKISKL